MVINNKCILRWLLGGHKLGYRSNNYQRISGDFISSLNLAKLGCLAPQQLPLYQISFNLGDLGDISSIHFDMGFQHMVWSSSFCFASS